MAILVRLYDVAHIRDSAEMVVLVVKTGLLLYCLRSSSVITNVVAYAAYLTF